MLRKNADVIELFASSEIRGVESGKCRAAHRAKAGRHNQPNSKHGDLFSGRIYRTRATSHTKATNLPTTGAWMASDMKVQFPTVLRWLLDAGHADGLGCYGPGGCAEVIGPVAQCIDARKASTKAASL
jgi:hypothetical protein